MLPAAPPARLRHARSDPPPHRRAPARRASNRPQPGAWHATPRGVRETGHSFENGLDGARQIALHARQLTIAEGPVALQASRRGTDNRARSSPLDDAFKPFTACVSRVSDASKQGAALVSFERRNRGWMNCSSASARAGMSAGGWVSILVSADAGVASAAAARVRAQAGASTPATAAAECRSPVGHGPGAVVGGSRSSLPIQAPSKV